MEFPVCPSCGQSVIDDDATDCPFCGSSMVAKPVTTAIPPKSTVASGTIANASVPVANRTQPPQPRSITRRTLPPKVGPAAIDDAADLSFSVASLSDRVGIPLMPNATRQRSMKVVCPMCETVGYVAHTAAGRDVKCVNAKCLLPIFKASTIVDELPPPAPPPKPKSLLFPVLGIVSALVVVAAVGLFVTPGLFNAKAKPVGMSEEDRALLAEMAREGQAGLTNVPKPSTVLSVVENSLPDKAQKTEPAPVTTEVLMVKTLKKMADVCVTAERQRSKPFCRQMAAEACAIDGQSAAAREHLAQILVVGKDVLYYRIVPNLELFWKDWLAGNKAAAVASIDAAVADSSIIPKAGRNRLEIASHLAAGLAAVGRTTEALAILQSHQSTEEDGQLACRLQIASEGRLTPLRNEDSLLPWSAPQAVATTAILLARGQVSIAQAWANGQPNNESRAECLSIWAEGLAKNSSPTGFTEAVSAITHAVGDLAPQLAARVLARAARGRTAVTDPAGSLEFLKLASVRLAEVKLPLEPAMPESKSLLMDSPPALAPLMQAATAAAEIAYAQSLSTESDTDVEATLDRALRFVRGIAPALPAVLQRSEEAQQAGVNGLIRMLKRDLSLKTDAEARPLVVKYRRNLANLLDASHQRFETQTKILHRMLAAGLKHQVWNVVQTSNAVADAGKRDEFLTTSLANELLEAFQKTEKEAAIRNALPENLIFKRPIQSSIRDLLTNQNIREAAEMVSHLDFKTENRDDVALTLAMELATSEKLDASLKFIESLTDIVLREEAYCFVAGLATQNGQAEVIVKQIGLVSQATEKAALCRGLTAGVQAASLLQRAAESVPAKSSDPKN
jgi:DNA-directed RNA polymerase subunit RPC12/RpoP